MNLVWFRGLTGGSGGEVLMRGLDIFSGVGGSSVGARDAGIDMIAVIDMWPLATETYRANFPTTDIRLAFGYLL